MQSSRLSVLAKVLIATYRKPLSHPSLIYREKEFQGPPDIEGIRKIISPKERPSPPKADESKKLEDELNKLLPSAYLSGTKQVLDWKPGILPLSIQASSAREIMGEIHNQLHPSEAIPEELRTETPLMKFRRLTENKLDLNFEPEFIDEAVKNGAKSEDYLFLFAKAFSEKLQALSPEEAQGHFSALCKSIRKFMNFAPITMGRFSVYDERFEKLIDLDYFIKIALEPIANELKNDFYQKKTAELVNLCAKDIWRRITAQPEILDYHLLMKIADTLKEYDLDKLLNHFVDNGTKIITTVQAKTEPEKDKIKSFYALSSDGFEEFPNEQVFDLIDLQIKYAPENLKETLKQCLNILRRKTYSTGQIKALQKLIIKKGLQSCLSDRKWAKFFIDLLKDTYKAATPYDGHYLPMNNYHKFFHQFSEPGGIADQLIYGFNFSPETAREFYQHILKWGHSGARSPGNSFLCRELAYLYSYKQDNEIKWLFQNVTKSLKSDKNKEGGIALRFLHFQMEEPKALLKSLNKAEKENFQESLSDYLNKKWMNLAQGFDLPKLENFRDYPLKQAFNETIPKENEKQFQSLLREFAENINSLKRRGIIDNYLREIEIALPLLEGSKYFEKFSNLKFQVEF